MLTSVGPALPATTITAGPGEANPHTPRRSLANSPVGGNCFSLQYLRMSTLELSCLWQIRSCRRAEERWSGCSTFRLKFIGKEEESNLFADVPSSAVTCRSLKVRFADTFVRLLRLSSSQPACAMASRSRETARFKFSLWIHNPLNSGHVKGVKCLNLTNASNIAGTAILLQECG